MKQAKILMEEAGLTGKDVGEALGVDRSAVSHFYRRQNGYMRADRLADFAGLLTKKLKRQIKIEDLLVWVEEAPVA